MSMTRKRYDELIEILSQTGNPVHVPEMYSEEVQNFTRLSKRETVELEAEGYPFKVYINTANHKTENAPLFINIHGGGWYIGHEVNDVYYAAWLAEQIGGVVVDVDYSTSGIAPWHVMHGQCMKAVEYALENARGLGCDENRISIGGYSAGGHLTASMVTTLAAEGKTPFALDILCYAPLDMRLKETAEPKDAKEARLKKRGDAFEELLLRGDNSIRMTPEFSPYITPDETLKNYPAAMVLTAGRCGFRFEDEAFGARLAALGVETTMQRFLNSGHGFIPHFFDEWEAAANLIVRRIVEARW